MSHPLLADTPGERHLLLGNEAIVRGALEAGINVVTCYPGTPSSEVPDTFRRIGGDGRYRLEYSVNEKVALEVGAGAALAGALTLVTMKHVGVNVAADPLLTMTYTGLPGGLVLLSADDPGCHSSQNEQDNRTYARFAGMPCFEPATAQEAKDMAREALLLSRETQQPVLLRTTTRVNHLRGGVTYGALPEPAAVVPFERNPRRFVPVPAVARARHFAQADVLGRVAELASASPWNTVHGEGRIGVIASGISRAYLADALHGRGLEGRVKVLELGFTWPLPERLLVDFLSGCDKVLVLEELEPLLERDVRALVQRLGLGVDVTGKGGVLTVFGEYSTTIVGDALSAFLGETPAAPVQCSPDAASMELPMRPPNLCAGCSHRAVYYAVRKVFGDDAYYSSDIGCYTLGLLPPLSMADFLFCMGSSISSGSGFAAASGRPVVAYIGDSTFFHSGITGLANALFNKHDVLVVILDNGTTAMTGHQPNPGVDAAVLGDACLHLDIEAIVRGCGVEQVATVHPYNLKATMAALEDMKQRTGVRVIIAQEPCVLYARRTLKKAARQTAYVAEQGPEVEACLAELACPAFRRDGQDIAIDSEQCSGCMVCLQVSSKIKARKRSA
ncbi:indolepyruvate ferredoxin oxidoreductase subunit alpha [Nitratidesulfovibrio vulgaris]|uniref:Indolepyruvate oxidoreductase subunit IorA n=1 Tax=Nitratidesulfovibrio vulgaris (strain DP4) TaxID=391774 RepID=A0A0H3A7S5_NITV4|nr:indolepyruvate ferredoxin oxidoreductase subunit alpha [Nitratidesulfovibrio vulgaris]ABM28237.1 Indolepyruvate ferredoxin oxidoreductase [Nitratidesulfovibrio vulgaris DP4]GEB80847.1 indolepyruvate oxidoreductase subunit IorA [Desulfovibrio desulfuricans]